MSDEDERLVSDHMTIQFLKYGFHLFITMVMTFLIVFTNDVPEENRKYLWFFGFMCWLTMLISTKMMEYIANEEDLPTERLFDYMFKLLITTFAFIFAGSILAMKLGVSTTQAMSSDSLTDGMFGLTTQGLSGGGQPITITLDKVQATATIMGGVGVISMLMNTFSHIYMYNQCLDGFDEEDTLIPALISAQYNVVVIGIISLAIFAIFKKKGGS